MNDWFDTYSMVHTEPQPSDSENGILFTTEYILLRLLETKLKDDNITLINFLLEKHRGKSVFFKQTPWGSDYTDKASHDNTTAAMVLSYICDLDHHKKFNDFYWHPRDYIYYKYLQNKLVGKVFLFIPIITMIVSCIRTTKVRNNKEFIHTDGKLLTFVRTGAGKIMPKTYKLCTWILKRKFGENPWSKIFEIYFKNEDHPNRKLSKRLGI